MHHAWPMCLIAHAQNKIFFKKCSDYIYVNNLYSGIHVNGTQASKRQLFSLVLSMGNHQL